MAIQVLAPMLVALSLVGGAARAELVTHAFGGVITATEPPYAHLLGESFSGTMTYDTSTPASLCLVQWDGSSYHSFPPYDPALGIEIDVGGIEQFSSDDTQALGLCVFDDNALFDDALLLWESNGLLVRLLDASRTAFGSEDIPVLLSEEVFDPRQLELWDASALLVAGRIDTLRLATNVPALGGAWTRLLGVLVAGVAVAAFRRRRT